MNRSTITRNQLRWAVTALQHDVVAIREEIEESEDGSPTEALGELRVMNLLELIDQLNDIANGTQKTISIK